MSELNHLKEISIEELENTIAKAISDMMRNKYECNISAIEYGVIGEAKLVVRVSIHNDLLEKFKSNNEQEVV